MPDDIEKGESSDNKKFLFVLTMHEGPLGNEPDPDDSLVGNAVLVSPYLAITAAHCLLYSRPNLSVRSAIHPRAFAKVKTILWPNGARFDFSSGPENYPPVSMENWPDSYIALVLDKPMHDPDDEELVVTPAVCTIANHVPKTALAIATRDSKWAGFIRYASMQVSETLNGIVIAVPGLNAAGYPRASGSAALTWDNSAHAPGHEDDALGTSLVGLQVTAPKEIPSFDVESRGQFLAGIMPMDHDRLGKIDEWMAIEEAERTAADRPESAPGSSIVGPALVAERKFIIKRRSDGAVMSGKYPLLTLPNSHFFHAKAWALYGARNVIGMLTTGGTLWTTRVPGTNDVDAQIVVFQSREVIQLRLYPGSSSPYGTLWLHGITLFRGKQVHVYLFRTTNGNNYDYPGHIRIVAIDAEGAYTNHRPEYHSIEFRPEAMPLGEKGMVRLRSLAESYDGFLASSDSDPVQDEVANGHEGHKPR